MAVKGSIAFTATGMLIGAALVGGVAMAATSTTVINACVTTKSGAVRIVADGVKCKTGETATNWNQTGPQGPQGIQGEQGPQGIQGEAGPPGSNVMAGYDRVEKSMTIPPGQLTQVMATCASNKAPVGGGYHAYGTPYDAQPPPIQIASNGPGQDIHVTVGGATTYVRGWRVGFYNADTVEHLVYVDAVCVPFDGNFNSVSQ